mmetsp:Transcript_8672/g.22297  ORF Transcript_8672/g.22297 Transcript_8672/m.22297 type:complete len:278 (-) Transcript_8672:20-853(-)
MRCTWLRHALRASPGGGGVSKSLRARGAPDLGQVQSVRPAGSRQGQFPGLAHLVNQEPADGSERHSPSGHADQRDLTEAHGLDLLLALLADEQCLAEANTGCADALPIEATRETTELAGGCRPSRRRDVGSDLRHGLQHRRRETSGPTHEGDADGALRSRSDAVDVSHRRGQPLRQRVRGGCRQSQRRSVGDREDVARERRCQLDVPGPSGRPSGELAVDRLRDGPAKTGVGSHPDEVDVPHFEGERPIDFPAFAAVADGAIRRHTHSVDAGGAAGT